MSKYEAYIKALRKCAKEHENEVVSFAHIRTTDLCNDTADLLERLDLGIEKSIDEMDELAKHKVKPISFDQQVAIEDCIKILTKNIESCEQR